jgi:hypothetical protein
MSDPATDEMPAPADAAAPIEGVVYDVEPNSWEGAVVLTIALMGGHPPERITDPELGRRLLTDGVRGLAEVIQARDLIIQMQNGVLTDLARVVGLEPGKQFTEMIGMVQAMKNANPGNPPEDAPDAPEPAEDKPQ